MIIQHDKGPRHRYETSRAKETHKTAPYTQIQGFELISTHIIAKTCARILTPIIGRKASPYTSGAVVGARGTEMYPSIEERGLLRHPGVSGSATYFRRQKGSKGRSFVSFR